MLRRNLLKSLASLIPVSFLNKNIVAVNEPNPKHTWEKIFRNEAGYPIRTEWSNGYWRENTYDENGNELTHRDSKGYWCEKTYDKYDGRLISLEDSKEGYHECIYNSKGKYILTEKIKRT